MSRLQLLVNGAPWAGEVDPRWTLADLLRERLRLTGTRLGCEQGVCGACTLLLDGAAVRSCLLLAVQADGRQVTTVEGLEDLPGRLRAAFQCGFCASGVAATAAELRAARPRPSREAVREALSAHICRCTGYAPIVGAVLACLE